MAQSHHAPTDLVVIDDDEMMLEIVTRNLRKSSARLQVFVSTEEAMDYLSQVQSMPRMLVIDFYMPTTTGVEFLARLREQLNLNATCVYICSAIQLQQHLLDQLHDLGASILEKDTLINRNSLQQLVIGPQYKNAA